MLRVGLTGGLGSGKSTVAALLREHGAVVVEADALGRSMMVPGEPVFAAIVQQFGKGILEADGSLDRAALAEMVFGRDAEGAERLQALNAIVHPAVIARQAEMAAEVERRDPRAVFVVETALLFETAHAGEGGWQRRFDRVVVVTAQEAERIERYAARGEGEAERQRLRAEARRRIEHQRPDAEKVGMADYVVRNEGSREQLAAAVEAVWRQLQAEAVEGPKARGERLATQQVKDGSHLE